MNRRYWFQHVTFFLINHPRYIKYGVEVNSTSHTFSIFVLPTWLKCLGCVCPIGLVVNVLLHLHTKCRIMSCCTNVQSLNSSLFVWYHYSCYLLLHPLSYCVISLPRFNHWVLALIVSGSVYGVWCIIMSLRGDGNGLPTQPN